jgi:ATPase subunit of ABC transporter with duplicated ATPase domains
MCGIGRKLVSFAVVISYCIFFMYRCYTLLKAGSLDTTAFVALFMMFTSTLGSMWWFVGIIQRGLKETGMLKSTSDSLAPVKNKGATQSTPSAAAHATPPPEGVGLDNVTFMYSSATTPTLRNLNLQVRPGEHVVITGENGSGKSTILKLLLRLIRPTSGDAYVNGRWYSQMTTQEVRRNFGYVPQNSVLFNRSVMDNIRYGNENKVSEDEVARWVESLGLTPEFSHLEGGIQGSAGKNGNNLSGGQRQLVMALRLLLRNPSVLVMDEPTASLDADTKQLLMRMIDAMAHESTLIMVSHDPYILKHIPKHIKI